MKSKKVKGYVYLLCDASQNLFKIGVTRGKIEKRIKQLQTGNGSEIHVSDYFLSEFPFNLEKILHNRFCEGKTIGEWFEMDNNNLSDFKRLCEEYESTLSKLHESDNPFF